MKARFASSSGTNRTQRSSTPGDEATPKEPTAGSPSFDGTCCDLKSVEIRVVSGSRFLPSHFSLTACRNVGRNWLFSTHFQLIRGFVCGLLHEWNQRMNSVLAYCVSVKGKWWTESWCCCGHLLQHWVTVCSCGHVLFKSYPGTVIYYFQQLFGFAIYYLYCNWWVFINPFCGCTYFLCLNVSHHPETLSVVVLELLCTVLLF